MQMVADAQPLKICDSSVAKQLIARRGRVQVKGHLLEKPGKNRFLLSVSDNGVHLV